MPNGKRKIILTTALTGAVTPKSINEHLPISPEEIAEDAYNCWKSGASIVHLHMRDDNAEGTMDASRFKKTIELIRAHKDCDVIINCTSSGTNYIATYEQRMEHFKTVPEIEMGSFDSGTFTWDCDRSFENKPDFLESLAKCMSENNILPECEIFDMGMLRNAVYYSKKGLLPSNLYCQIVLGVLGGAPATPAQLEFIVRNLPEGTKWSAFGIGKDHLPIMYAALALGADGIRVGLEDNVYYSKGVKATNVMLTSRAVRVIKNFDCEVASPAEAREILGIKPLER